MSQKSFAKIGDRHLPVLHVPRLLCSLTRERDGHLRERDEKRWNSRVSLRLMRQEGRENKKTKTKKENKKSRDVRRLSYQDSCGNPFLRRWYTQMYSCIVHVELVFARSIVFHPPSVKEPFFSVIKRISV